MITGKQRASLRALAHGLTPIVIIGKDGLNDGVIDSIRDGLYARELIKIRLLSSCELSTRDVSNKICDMLGCEAVQCIGSILVIYKKSNKPNIEHIEF